MFGVSQANYSIFDQGAGYDGSFKLVVSAIFFFEGSMHALKFEFVENNFMTSLMLVNLLISFIIIWVCCLFYKYLGLTCTCFSPENTMLSTLLYYTACLAFLDKFVCLVFAGMINHCKKSFNFIFLLWKFWGRLCILHNLLMLWISEDSTFHSVNMVTLTSSLMWTVIW